MVTLLSGCAYISLKREIQVMCVWLCSAAWNGKCRRMLTGGSEWGDFLNRMYRVWASLTLGLINFLAKDTETYGLLEMDGGGRKCMKYEQWPHRVVLGDFVYLLGKWADEEGQRESAKETEPICPKTISNFLILDSGGVFLSRSFRDWQ